MYWIIPAILIGLPNPVDYSDPSGLATTLPRRPCDPSKDVPVWYLDLADTVGLVGGFLVPTGGIIRGAGWVLKSGKAAIAWLGVLAAVFKIADDAGLLLQRKGQPGWTADAAARGLALGKRAQAERLRQQQKP